MATNQNDWLHPDNPEEVEVRHLTENTDLSPDQAKALVREHGTDRTKLMELAKTRKAES